MNHFAVSENGRFFFVPRGGGAIDQRPQNPITSEQFEEWEGNGRIAMLLALFAAFSGLTAAGLYLYSVYLKNAFTPNEGFS